MKDILRVVMGEDGRKKSRGVMPIIGWVNPSVNTYMTAAADRKRVSHEELYRRYEEYRGAGFNMVFCMGTAVGASDDGLVEEILEICEKLELGCLLIDAQTYSRPFTEKRLQELYEFASRYASFKGLMVYDEPNVSAFPTLAQNYVMFRKYFPDKLFYVNLLPNYATDEQLGTDNYAKYVAEYAKMVKQGYLSYDHYPFIHYRKQRQIFQELVRNSPSVATEPRTVHGICGSDRVCESRAHTEQGGNFLAGEHGARLRCARNPIFYVRNARRYERNFFGRGDRAGRNAHGFLRCGARDQRASCGGIGYSGEMQEYRGNFYGDRADERIRQDDHHTAGRSDHFLRTAQLCAERERSDGVFRL